MPAIRETLLKEAVDALLAQPPTPSSSASSPPKEEVTAQLLWDCHNSLGEGIVFDERRHMLLWTDINGGLLHTLSLKTGRASTYEVARKVGSLALLHDNVLQALSGSATDTTTSVAAAADPPLDVDMDATTTNNNNTPNNNSSLPVLLAWEDGFQLYDVEHEKALSEMSTGTPQEVNPHKGSTRLNDGRTDPQGRRFICGGYYGEQDGVTMKVFQVELHRSGTTTATNSSSNAAVPPPPTLSHQAIVDNLQVTNSICWSPDGRTMYLADSPTRQIHKYQYDTKTGQVSDKTLFHQKDDALVIGGVPDGSTVDAEGYVWNAVWRSGAGPGMVQRIDPTTGQVVFTVHLPHHTSQVTCCCFGGLHNDNLDVLFITTAAEHRDPTMEPHAGGLYAVKLPFHGQPEAKLDFAPY